MGEQTSSCFECAARVSSHIPQDDEPALMSVPRREAGHIEMPEQIKTQPCGSAAVCMQLGCSAGSNKSIRSVVVIRRHIHLKGQACWKQMAEDIHKYYIIYGMNILRPAGVREMNKHTEAQ